MRRGRVAAAVAAVLVVAGWFYLGAAPLAGVGRALDVWPGNSTPQTLQAAGVHKCVDARGTTYRDGPCPNGSHEVAAHGGTLTMMSFQKPAPAPSAFASGILGGPIVKPMSNLERDQLRDKQVDDAANR